MTYRWLVSGRDLVLIGLALTCAILLAVGSALYGYHARQQIHAAYEVIQHADSLMRSCKP